MMTHSPPPSPASSPASPLPAGGHARTPLEFTNVGRKSWYQQGFFASQTAYVAAALLIIMILMGIFSANFFSIGNLTNIAKNFSFIAIATLGMTLVITKGGIDLSVGSVMAFSAIVCAGVMSVIASPETTLSPGMLSRLGPALELLGEIPYGAMIFAMIAALSISALIGLINGVLIAKLGLSPFVTTLGMLSVVRGLGYAVTEGRGQTPRGPDADLFYKLTDGTLFHVPIELVYMLILALVLGLVVHQTAFGRYIYAIGGNEKAAQLTGVPVARIKISVYMLCSIFAGFSGVLMTGWLGSAPANLATGYELTIIAAAVIGGANLAGGSGGPLGAVIGALLIETIRNGLVLMGINAYWQIVFVGCIIIIAVLVDRLRLRKIN